MPARVALVVFLAASFLLPAQIYLSESASATEPPPLTWAQLGFMEHIDHIVYVVLENHAYDSYFGTYCQQTSPLCPYAASGIPAGTCVPYKVKQPNGPCIRPFNFTDANWTVTGQMLHNYGASVSAWNQGAMNGFYAAEHSGLNPFGHYNGTTAPIPWDLAEEYTLSDNFFSSVLSYSLPNHWHIVAGQAPQIIVRNGTLGCTCIPANTTIANDHAYLSEANQTKSIEDELIHNTSVSWKYYEYALGTYANAIKITTNSQGNLITGTGRAYDYWNAQAAKAESYNASFSSHYVLNSQFYWDAKNGTLPDLSWVIPPGQDSDHPPDNSSLAQGWLASIVDAVEASPEWNTTAIYVTWDDYGGFYDNVAPPTYQGQQLGFRVPLLIISAWTKAGFVTSQMDYFESVLRLMEWRFHLGCIAVLDCKAPLPLVGFGWNLKTPRAPIMFPTSLANATYPYNPNWNGTAKVPLGSYTPPSEFVNFPDGQAPDID
jgi:phospholipase C